MQRVITRSKVCAKFILLVPRNAKAQNSSSGMDDVKPHYFDIWNYLLKDTHAREIDDAVLR